MSDASFDPMKFYLSIEGRVGRQDYWMKLFVPILVVAIILGIVARGNTAVSIVFNLLVLWPSLAVSIKRWHDRDKTGWWVLINLIPIIGWIWALVENGFLKGTEGDNRFGPSPV